MPNLLWFEWHRDPEGYRTEELWPEFVDVSSVSEASDWTARPLPGAPESTVRLLKLDVWPRLRPEANETSPVRYLAPVGRKRELIRPLDMNPVLFMEFSDLPSTATAIGGFAAKYGCLWDGAPVSPLEAWYFCVGRMREAVDLWKQARDSGDFGAIVDLFDSHDTGLDFTKGPRLNARLVEQTLGSPSLHIVPVNLMEALWLQFAQAVSANTQLRRCVWCSTWFVFGTGTGRRKSGHYCTERCRKAHYRARKSETVGRSERGATVSQTGDAK